MSSKGFVFLAQNNEDTDYVRQAYALACSIKATQKEINQTCLITNDEVPEKYKKVFDHIVPIPWDDAAEKAKWKIENRWKIYHVTPFEENIVLDVDMLLLSDISTWWTYFEGHDLYFTTNVRTYRDQPITEGLWFYRKAFNRYNLPNTYVGLHYFKKSDKAHEFYKWLEFITQNWEVFYGNYAGGNLYQKWNSIDVSAALAIKLMDIENEVTNKTSEIPKFTHMKTYHQGWNNLYNSWQDYVKSYFDDNLNLKVGNYVQGPVFHYVEDSFLTDKIIETYENYLELK